MATGTRIYTFLTVPTEGTQLLIRSLPDEWLEIVLRLDTVGPVAIGTSQDILPSTSGKGMLLPANQETRVHLSPDATLFIAAETVNRVGVQINAIPAIEQLLSLIATSGRTTQAAAQRAVTESVPIGNFGFVGAKKKR